MTRPTSNTRKYRIIIQGECGRLLVSLIDNLRVEPSQNGDTRVVAVVRDDPEFWGLMEQLRDLALHIVTLQELGHGNGRQTPRQAGKSRRTQVAERQHCSRTPTASAQQEDPSAHGQPVTFARDPHLAEPGLPDRSGLPLACG